MLQPHTNGMMVGRWHWPAKDICGFIVRTCPNELRQALTRMSTSVHVPEEDVMPVSDDGVVLNSGKPTKLVAKWCKLSRSLKWKRSLVLDKLTADTLSFLRQDGLSLTQGIRILVQCGWTEHQPPCLVDKLCEFLLLNMYPNEKRMGVEASGNDTDFKGLVELISVLSLLKARAHHSENRIYKGNSHVSQLYNCVLADIKGRKWEGEKRESLLPLLCAICSWGQGVRDNDKVFLDQLLSIVTRDMGYYNGRQLTRLVNCIGLLGAGAKGVIDTVVGELKKRKMSDDLDPTGLSILAESFGKARCLSISQFEGLFQCFFSPLVLEKMSNRNLCSLLKGLSYYDNEGTKWMMDVLREATIPPRLNLMNPQDILGLLFVCGRTNLCSTARVIIDRIVSSFLGRELHELPNNVLVNIMHGIGLNKHRIVGSWIKLYTEAGKSWRVGSYTPREIAVLCWTMASTGNYERTLFEKLVRLYSLTPQLQLKVDTLQIGISQVLYSCAQYRHRNLQLFQEIWMGVKRLDNFLLPDLAQLIWTLSVVGCLRKDQYTYFLQLFEQSNTLRHHDRNKLERYMSEIELYMMSRRSTSGSDIQQHISKARFGYEVEDTPNKFVAEIQTCLRVLNTGGWLVCFKNLLHGFVFSTNRDALLIPLKSADYAYDLIENCLILRGPYAAKIENLERIGYKVACIEQYQWDTANEGDRLNIVRQCLRIVDA